MLAAEFDQEAFFQAIESSQTRALLIGRQALIVLGLPVLTKDYDFWLAFEDIERFNAALASFELRPSRSPAEARRVGRYVPQSRLQAADAWRTHRLFRRWCAVSRSCDGDTVGR